jgi:uncharacterized protein (DUF2147 family)
MPPPVAQPRIMADHDFAGHAGKRTMRRLMLVVTVLATAQFSIAGAEAANPDGTWLVNQRVAFDVFQCRDALCGRIVWLRNPALRTAEMCGRTIVWGLTSDGPEQWGNGWFFDPEDGNTYNISAQIETNDRISARIYKGISLFGRTEIMTRIAARSLPGWCGTEPSG